MKQTYTPVIEQDGDWWIGWIEEVPGVNCQEASKTALLTSLRETLVEARAFAGFGNPIAEIKPGHNPV